MIATSSLTADEALARLIAGNERFRRGESDFHAATLETLHELAHGQAPSVTVLGCSDSRVAPERIFDAQMGELFVVRVAGNVFSPEVAGSLQYAGAHLHTPLFVVLGHEGCGAVAAALDAKRTGRKEHRHIQILVDSILPGLSEVERDLAPPAALSRAVECNVRWTVRQICRLPEARSGLEEGRVKMVGAIYEIESGRVRFL